MKQRSLIILLTILFVFSFLAVAQARITKCFFNVWTHAQPGQELQVVFYFELEDTNYPIPGAINTLQVKAPDPDGTVFDFSADYWNYWYEWGGFLYFAKVAGDFKNGVIPSGTYKATLVDKSSKTLSNSDSLPATAINTPLAPATITNPPPYTPPDPPPPLPLGGPLTWNKVTNAQFYRVFLFNETRKEYVYFAPPSKYLHVYTNSFVVPKGVLTPNHTYSMRIEARDSDKNMSRRSRSVWATFKAVP